MDWSLSGSGGAPWIVAERSDDFRRSVARSFTEVGSDFFILVGNPSDRRCGDSQVGDDGSCWDTAGNAMATSVDRDCMFVSDWPCGFILADEVVGAGSIMVVCLLVHSLGNCGFGMATLAWRLG